MNRTTERKWHSWLNGVALTICPSMWRRQRRLCWTSGGGTPLTIDSSTVERVSSTKFLGVHITEDLTWTTNTMSLSKKAQQRLHFLRRLKRASLPPPILTTFYRGTIESVLTSCITVWYGNCSAADRKTLQQTVKHGCKDHRCPSPIHPGHFLARCSSKTNSIVKDPTPPLPQSLPAPTIRKTVPEHQRPAPPDCSTAFSPGWEPWTQITPPPLWNPMQTPTSWNMDHPPSPKHPPTLPHQRKKLNFFCAIQVCYTQVSGPVQTTCSNTLSSMH